MATECAIGIDLGTTYSVVSYFQHGKVEIIANDLGYRTTPSCVAFCKGEGQLVGEAAVNQGPMNVTNTVFDVKRLIGRRFNDPCVQADMKNWPFCIVNVNGRPKIKVICEGKERLLYPEEISAIVLGKMRDIAEAYIGNRVTKAVVTVPAYFNDCQRQATKDAGRIAGLTVDKIISEPVAGAVAYGLHTQVRDKKNILVFDLGGGTFDVSILSLESGIFEVKATSGNTHLGGRDFDTRMVEHFVKEFQRKYKKNLNTSKRALLRLSTACEKAKRLLSTHAETSVNVDVLFEGIDFQSTISRAKFEDLNKDLFSKLLEPVKQALNDANMITKDIDDIVLIGGSSRIPKVQDVLQKIFNGKELKRNINPDEAVAYGAAIKAAMEYGDSSEDILEIVLRDVTPLSLGVSIYGGLMSVIVERNTSIPTLKTRSYETVHDNQIMLAMGVYEGEREIVKDNHLLGEFQLIGLPLAPAGQVKINVTFKVDENGILDITAVETSTGKETNVTVKSNRENLTKEEIKHLIDEANNHREEDLTERKRIESRNSLESYFLKMRNKAKEDKLNKADFYNTFIIEKCNETEKWLETHKQAKKEVYDALRKSLVIFCNHK